MMTFLQSALIVYFTVYVLYAIGNALVSKRLIKKMREKFAPLPLDEYKNDPVTVIIPAYNEEVMIATAIRNMSQMKYPYFKIIVVNDGSTDNTMEVLKKEFNLMSVTADLKGDLETSLVKNYYKNHAMNLTVIDKFNGGKADAFNAALNIVDTRYVITVDADTLLTEDAIQKLMTPVILDRTVVAVGAQVCVANESALDEQGTIKEFQMTRNYFFGTQALEYMKTFLLYRTGHNAAGATLLISGACGLFSTKMLRNVGGFDRSSVCEDIEITMRIQEYVRATDVADRIEFVADPVAWTEAPSTYTSLFKQRNRWFRGSAQTLWKYKHTLFNPKMGAMGFYTVPAYWLFGYFAPVAQLLSVILFVWLGAPTLLLLWGIVAAAIINMITISMMKHTSTPIQKFRYKLWLFWYGMVETFWMQFVLMVINLKSMVDAFLGKRDWNKFERVGFNKYKDMTNE